MAKLSNGIEYYNSFFPPAFGEYLINNGFITDLRGSALYFQKNATVLIVMHNNIDVFIAHPEATDPSQRFQFDHQIPDIYQCKNIFAFIELMDAHKIQPITEFVNNASKIDKQLGVEADFLLNSIAYLKTLS